MRSLVILTLVLVATSGGLATATDAEPQVVTSDDGDVTVEIPAGAAPQGIEASVRLLDPSDWPEQLASAATIEGVRIYELAPAGTEFSTPVTVTRRFDRADFGDHGTPDRIPLVVLATSTVGGDGFELLDDQVAEVDGGDLFVSANTTHFSPLISSFGQNSFLLGGPLVGGAGCPAGESMRARPSQCGGGDAAALMRYFDRVEDEAVGNADLVLDDGEVVAGWVFQDVDVWLEGEDANFDWRVDFDADTVDAEVPDQCDTAFVGTWNAPVLITDGLDSIDALVAEELERLTYEIRTPIALPCPDETQAFADSLAAGPWAMRAVTVHEAQLEGFPSFEDITATPPAGFGPADVTVVLFDHPGGIPGPETRIVALDTVTFTGGQPTSFPLGIECYCGYGLAATPDPLPPGADPPTLGALRDLGAGVWLFTTEASHDPHVLRVTPDEGVILDDVGAFELMP